MRVVFQPSFFRGYVKPRECRYYKNIYIYYTVGCSCSHTSFHLSPKEQDTVPVKKHRKDPSLIFSSQSPGKLKIHLGEVTPINQHFSQSRSGSNCDKLLPLYMQLGKQNMSGNHHVHDHLCCGGQIPLPREDSYRTALSEMFTVSTAAGFCASTASQLLYSV